MSPRVVALVLPVLLLACAESASAPPPRAPVDVPVGTVAPLPPAPSGPAPPASGELTDAQVIEMQTPQWKLLLAQLNHVPVSEIDRVVTVGERRIRRAPGRGDAFMDVEFTYHVDWLSVPAFNTVLVRLGGGNPLTKLIGLGGQPVHWVSAAELAPFVADPMSRAFTGTRLSLLAFPAHLKVASRDAALAAIRRAGAPARFDDNDSTRFEFPTAKERTREADPDIYFDALRGYVGNDPNCVTVRLDLITGVAVRGTTWCGPVN